MTERLALDGDNVRVHYTGKLQDGSVFDSSEGDEPLEFTLGAGDIIPGFDRGVTGMRVREKKTIEVLPEEAYGFQRDDLVLRVPREELGPEIEPEVGMMLRMRTPSGRFVPVKVVVVTEEEVALDANHPLAGQALVFELELVEIL